MTQDRVPYRTDVLEHMHCWHAVRGPVWMVVPDGHIVQKCCTCSETRTVHADHAGRER